MGEMTAADILSEKARSHELNALAAQEREESFRAFGEAMASVVLYEVAEALRAEARYDVGNEAA